MGLPNPSRETKFSGANAGKEIFIFPVQPTTSRIGNLTRLIHTLALCVTIHTYISTYIAPEIPLFFTSNAAVIVCQEQSTFLSFSTQ